ncbi:hypothetical protein CANARDRAFT_26675 [[Candida] arabinofermentans NRRL YB-2248]|uniref:Hyaluronan/mRNA-binding protein domain-containing protein n=1 Tax=[Candida] arabinofermentans NRRL YB-2248 TaxID=983967 RepID=A0A1E4T682_9ASCO|nr:hypothetical protein CANARDRAFT_26675 [[Candida] arabinofermentans NRRL YB-2248]
MARTQKWNDKGSNSEPRFFTHTGNYGESPNHVKKDGFGKGNWGKQGDELEDLMSNGEIPPVFKKERRGSNHSLNEERIKKVQQATFEHINDDEAEE